MAHLQKQQENWSVLLVLDTRFLRSSFTPARTPRGNSSSTFGTMTAPPVCSFYARGACTRGQACPYRHEGAQHAASTHTMTNSSTRSESQRPSRSASSMPLIEKVPGAKALDTPSDAHIRTLFFANLPVDMDQDKLRTVLLTSIPKLDQCNAIAHIQMIMSSHCAFVHFKTRDNAECAADALATKVYMQGQHQVRVAWGRRPPSSAS